ncbi:MAG: ComF family protein [Actinomycetota bacterium]|nr:ComF family protein [Actinomycetota bacterium]
MREIAELVGRAACAGCGRRGVALCRDCEARLGVPDHRSPPPGIDRLICPYRYEGAPRSLVLDLKGRGRRDAAQPLADALVRVARRAGVGAEVVTWVPCGAVDRRRRGFDHAELLARTAADALGLPCGLLLRRAGAIRDQVGLSARERLTNLKGAFTARPAPASVCLVDDVITTGATAGCCAAALRGAGAREIELLVACSA